MARRTAAVVVFALLVGLVAQAQAQEHVFSEGVRPSGMGLAYTGLASGAASLYHNPGGVTSRLMYQIEGGYEFNPDGSVLNAAIVDSKTNPDIGAGVSASYFLGRGDLEDVNGWDLRLGVALPVLPEEVSVGVGGRYIRLNGHIPDGEDGEEGDQQVTLLEGITVDAGIVFRPYELLQFGVAGRNLIDNCDRDDCTKIAPTTVSGGVSVGDEVNYLLALDGGIDLTSDPDDVHPFVEVGGEYFAAGTLPIRSGYQWLPALDRHVITAGTGVRLETAGLDFGLRLDPADSDYLYVNGSVSVFF